MYLTSKLGPGRDIWAVDIEFNPDKQQRTIQRAVDQTTKHIGGRTILGLTFIGIALLCATFLAWSGIASITLGDPGAINPLIQWRSFAAVHGIVLIAYLAFVAWGLIRRHQSLRQLRRIDANRRDNYSHFITPAYYSFQQLFYTDKEWFEATNFSYGQACEFINQYFDATRLMDITIMKGGQDVQLLEQGVAALAAKARKACTDDAIRRMQADVDASKRIDFKPQPPLD